MVDQEVLPPKPDQNADAQIFVRFPIRRTWIRPAKSDEFKGEFWSLGPHDPSRRMVLLLRVDDARMFGKNKILVIPFLKFADEDISNEDDVLLPIIDGIMKGAANQHNIRVPKGRR